MNGHPVLKSLSDALEAKEDNALRLAERVNDAARAFHALSPEEKRAVAHELSERVKQAAEAMTADRAHGGAALLVLKEYLDAYHAAQSKTDFGAFGDPDNSDFVRGFVSNYVSRGDELGHRADLKHSHGFAEGWGWAAFKRASRP